MADFLSILILTRNEEQHIARCLESAFRITHSVYVLDSNSSDRTQCVARGMGAQVLSGDFDMFAGKLNWGLEHIEFKTPWVMRLDADEILSDGFVEKAQPFLESLDGDIVGVYVRRQLWFMGSMIRFGGMYPTYSMRLWRPGAVYCESRALDEHMILRYGQHANLEADVMDIPLTDLSTWISKHNGYSTLEARSTLRATANSSDNIIKPSILGTLPQRVRWVKTHVFYRLPPFLRPFLYYFYRYILRLGFLDGRAGLVFHFMHGLWYRLLVDAKIMEMRRQPPNTSQFDPS